MKSIYYLLLEIKKKYPNEQEFGNIMSKILEDKDFKRLFSYNDIFTYEFEEILQKVKKKYL